jgi:hypothetical protein
MGIEKFNNAFGLSLLFMGVGTLLGNPIGGMVQAKETFFKRQSQIFNWGLIRARVL